MTTPPPDAGSSGSGSSGSGLSGCGSSEPGSAPDAAPGALPAGRYSRNAARAPGGPDTPRSRRARLLLSVAGGLFGLLIAFIAYRNLSGGPVSAEQQRFSVVDDSTMSITIDVTRSDPEQDAVCIVRGRSIDGSETGRREVYVPASPDMITTVTTELRTSAPPVASDVYGCSLTVPEYLRP